MKHTKKPVRKKAPIRRTQAERRETTRKRILEATLDCLSKHGYAGTTLSLIVKRAGISHGAHVHHYPSMDELFVEATQYLMQQVYERLEQITQSIANSDDRLEGVMEQVWQEFFTGRVNDVYIELLVASRSSERLAKTFASLTLALERFSEASGNQYFESTPGAAGNVREMIMLSRWLMRGMALDAHLAPDMNYMTRHRKVWRTLLAQQIRARKIAVPRSPVK